MCRSKYGQESIDPEILWMKGFKVRFELQNLYRTVFVDNTFDIVINIDVIQHCYHYREVLTELVRITKRILIVRTWVGNEEKIAGNESSYSNIYSRSSLIGFMKELVSDVSDRGNGLYIMKK
jgi:ubiquinone/menaquinone biosynthesis C-methylase UbiE